MLIKEELIAFEQDIANEFNAGKIRAPIHLSGGNEDQLIEIFKNVASYDWVCSTWRSHYHALLHGVPPAQLKTDILAGKSITLCYPAQKFITSAIVGGIVPIALGLAWACKNHPERSIPESSRHPMVWAFIGDMTFQSGIVDEVMRYAENFKLPLHIVVEDNGLSVCTDTKTTWGSETKEAWMTDLTCDDLLSYNSFKMELHKKVHIYSYKLPWPHSGAGKRVEF